MAEPILGRHVFFELGLLGHSVARGVSAGGSELRIDRRRSGSAGLARRPVLEREQHVCVGGERCGDRLLTRFVAHDDPLRVVRLAVHEQDRACAPHPAERDALQTVHEDRGERQRVTGMTPELGLGEQQPGERVVEQRRDRSRTVIRS